MRILGTASTRLPFYSDWLTEVSADSPYGWFRLNEDPVVNLTTAIDNGSAATNGTYSSVTGISAGTTPLITYSGNEALSFSQTAVPYITLNNTIFGTDMMNNNAFSAEMVFMIESNAADDKATAGRQNADATGWGLYATTNSSNEIVVTAWAGNIFATGIDGSTGVAWVANEPYHIVYTCDSVNAYVYVNGVRTNSLTIGSQPYTIPTTTGGYVGALASFTGTYDRSRRSKIDEIVFYRSALSAERVAAHAAAAQLYN